MNLPIDQDLLGQLSDWAKQAATENKIEYGLAEMALGAAILAWGVKHDAIALGAQLVGLATPALGDGANLGSSGGFSLGLLSGTLIESIGVAGGFGAVGVPAAVLAGGAAVVLGAVGYTAGDLIDMFAAKADALAAIIPASALAIGTALLLHGALRAAKDERLAGLEAQLKDGVIALGETVEPVIVESKSAFDALLRNFQSEPQAAVSAMSGAGLGAAAGGTAAAASVTVLGSQTLGGLALSAGLVSAPVWPIAAGVVGGGAVGYGLWKLFQSRRRRLPAPPPKLPAPR